MRTLKMVLVVILAFACQAAMADSPSLNSKGPLGELQAQIDTLSERIQSLENDAPTADVDGRSYCMMANITLLRAFASSATESVETRVVRRVANFSGGTWSATLVSSNGNVQDDNGVVTNGPGNSPGVISGTYTQSGRHLDIVDSDGLPATWYVSGDGSIIHNNGIGFLGPFPSTFTLGLVRSVVFVESETCDGA